MMKSVGQLLRQPMKTLIGVVLAAAGCCGLCISLAQFTASRAIGQQLESLFQPVAFPSAAYEKEADDWLADYARQNPEVVTHIGGSGLVSAYIPGIVPDNYTQHCPPLTTNTTGDLGENFLYLPNRSAAQYTCAMLRITLEEIGTPVHESYEYIQDSGEYGLAQTQRMTVKLKGTVEEVIGLEQGYNSPVGYTADLTLCVADQGELEALNLIPGQQYLVFGTDYVDEDYNLRRSLTLEEAEDGTHFPFIQSFDPDKLHLYTQEELENVPGALEEQVVGYYAYDNGIAVIKSWYSGAPRTIKMTLWDASSMPLYTYEKDVLGQVAEVAHPQRSFVTSTGEKVTMGVEEYHSLYAEPTIVKIETSVADFLASGQGTQWAKALQDIEINSHSFPLIGVEDVGMIPDFFQGTAEISQGRDFTQQELSAGAKVCLISEQMAKDNGLTLGDTLSLETYRNDLGVPYQTDIASGNGACMPMACYYFGTTMSRSPAQGYTIVGIYRQDSPWANYYNHFYAFTPNTIFVPLETVKDMAEYSYTGLFRWVEINGAYLERFLEDIGGAGYSGQLLVDDNGYTSAAAGVADYSRIAQTAVWVSLGVFVLVLLLFTLLYPGLLTRTMFTMECLGATPKERRRYVLQYAWGMILPGAVLGTIAGVVGWKYVTALSGTAGKVEPAITLSPGVFLLAAVLYLGIFSGGTAVTAILLSRDRGIRRK